MAREETMIQDADERAWQEQSEQREYEETKVKVYKAINAVQAELAKTGISKDRVNEQQRYKFRGVDEVYNALSPLLAKHGLCILPRVVSRECVERESAQQKALFYVTVHMEFDFVASEDGSKHTVVTYGEAMDSGDKATNKAMSAAYKYACMQAFSIPTEGDNDADATTHEVRINPVKNAMEDEFLPPEEIESLKNLAAELVQIIEIDKNEKGGFMHLQEQKLNNTQKLFLWNVLSPNSKTRAALKRQGQQQ
jgi:hypothetical protein